MRGILGGSFRCHGLTVRSTQKPPNGVSIPAVLLARADDAAAPLLVFGTYGYPRIVGNVCVNTLV